MKLRIKQGIIYDENDMILGSLNDGTPEDVEKTIECGSDAIPVIQEFLRQVNSGSFKPRTVVKEFERLLERHEISII